MKQTLATVLLIGLALSGEPWQAAPAAQRNQPIYPAYDGYVKNPDGSYTLSFAYFSHNAEPVTIPPGRENTFAPAPGDRGQATTFLPGHWRFQCVMVLGPDFDGHLVWTVTYGGTSTGTSQNMLISSYNLVEGAAELKRIDYAHAPRGVCLNQAPDVRVLGVRPAGRGQPPVVDVGAGEELDLFGSVHDEGLPRGAALDVSWAKLSGPGNVRFSNAKEPRTLAFFDAPGLYELELTASDSELTSRTRLNVQVHSASR